MGKAINFIWSISNSADTQDVSLEVRLQAPRGIHPNGYFFMHVIISPQPQHAVIPIYILVLITDLWENKLNT